MRNLRHAPERAAENLDEPRLSIAPLIDVCFLLLIYFMVTTTIKPAERDVGASTATEGPRISRAVTVMIQVRADGAIVANPGPHELVMSVDPGERELPQLEEFLSLLMVGETDLPPVMLRADADAMHQRVVDVMNVLNKIGWTTVGFVDDPD